MDTFILFPEVFHNQQYEEALANKVLLSDFWPFFPKTCAFNNTLGVTEIVF